MQKEIFIKGARENNLKNIDVTIPRDKLVVLTGLSGSGKSSLAFDTIYAEGQRRYVESLSSYARMFLGQMDKPDVDYIDGLSPAISIDQKTTSKNPRSTVGTVTEIYDYLRLLFARVGTPHCPECGRVIERQTTDQVADKVLERAQGRRALVLAPVVLDRKGEYTKLFEDLRREGFSRVRIDGEVRELGDEEIRLEKKLRHNVEVVVDRIVVRENSLGRIAEAVEQATKLAGGRVSFYLMPDRDDPERLPGELLSYSLALACPEHGHSMDDLQPRDFSFNAPYGACPDCDGLGFRKVVDAEALIEDPSLSVAGGVFGSLFGHSNYYPQVLAAVCRHLGASEDTPWKDLPKKVQSALLDGLGATKVRVDYLTRDGRNTHWFTTFAGVRKILFDKYQETTSDTMRAHLEKYIREVPCSTCNGARLKPEILAVTVGEKNIWEVCELSCREALAFFEALELTDRQRFIAGAVVKEILARLRFLVNVGLDYLTLSRAAATLSGGEAQRIRLATQIGAGLMGVLYILDEPSIGLHQRDNERLIATLERLRDLAAGQLGKARRARGLAAGQRVKFPGVFPDLAGLPVVLRPLVQAGRVGDFAQPAHAVQRQKIRRVEHAVGDFRRPDHVALADQRVVGQLGGVQLGARVVAGIPFMRMQKALEPRVPHAAAHMLERLSNHAAHVPLLKRIPDAEAQPVIFLIRARVENQLVVLRAGNAAQILLKRPPVQHRSVIPAGQIHMHDADLHRRAPPASVHC